MTVHLTELMLQVQPLSRCCTYFSHALDLTLAGSGASFSAGKIRTYAVLQDVSDIGEMEADEVGKDQLVNYNLGGRESLPSILI